MQRMPAGTMLVACHHDMMWSCVELALAASEAASGEKLSAAVFCAVLVRVAACNSYDSSYAPLNQGSTSFGLISKILAQVSCRCNDGLE